MQRWLTTVQWQIWGTPAARRPRADTQILKVASESAWRTPHGTGELAEFYKRMEEIIEGAGRTIRGMVNLESIACRDVYFKGTESGSPLAVPMTQSTLCARKTDPQMSDMPLHRVAFDNVGKPLWKYQSPDQLVRAMRMALVAHRDLCSLGISRRDISAGNILIRSIPAIDGGTFEEREKMGFDKTEGFLTDFEFAVLLRSESAGPEMAPGDEMTGTVAFMASSLLQDIQNAKPGEAASRTAEQDIESFAWLFVFMVYKHALEDPNVILKQNESRALKEEFNRLFPGGSATPESILTARYIMHSPDSNQHILQHIQTYYVENHPEHFCDLFECIWEVLVSQLPRASAARRSLIKARVASHSQPPPPSATPPPLVHDDILALFGGYLELIEEVKARGNSRRIS